MTILSLWSGIHCKRTAWRCRSLLFDFNVEAGDDAFHFGFDAALMMDAATDVLEKAVKVEFVAFDVFYFEVGHSRGCYHFCLSLIRSLLRCCSMST